MALPLVETCWRGVVLAEVALVEPLALVGRQFGLGVPLVGDDGENMAAELRWG